MPSAFFRHAICVEIKHGVRYLGRYVRVSCPDHVDFDTQLQYALPREARLAAQPSSSISLYKLLLLRFWGSKRPRPFLCRTILPNRANVPLVCMYYGTDWAKLCCAARFPFWVATPFLSFSQKGLGELNLDFRILHYLPKVVTESTASSMIFHLDSFLFSVSSVPNSHRY